MKTINRFFIAFAIGFIFMLFSCQKENEIPVVDDQQSTQSFQSLIEISESGIDIESLEFPESTTLSYDYPTTSRFVGLTFFSDPAVFAAACPDLPTEDFEEGVGYIIGFAGPLDENSSNVVFSPGDILPGVSFNSNTDRGGFELVFVDETAGFGNLEGVVLANFFVDTFVINFTASDVTGVSMDVVDIASVGGDVVVEIFGSSGSLGTINIPSTSSGTFLGIMSSEAITMITLFSTGDGAEGLDNISFGTCIVDTDGDGCIDDNDEIINSNMEATVTIDGCDSGVPNEVTLDSCGITMSDVMDELEAGEYRNHGQFVRAVASVVNGWYNSGSITLEQKDAIMECAGEANIPAN